MPLVVCLFCLLTEGGPHGKHVIASTWKNLGQNTNMQSGKACKSVGFLESLLWEQHYRSVLRRQGRGKLVSDKGQRCSTASDHILLQIYPCQGHCLLGYRRCLEVLLHTPPPTTVTGAAGGNHGRLWGMPSCIHSSWLWSVISASTGVWLLIYVSARYF